MKIKVHTKNIELTKGMEDSIYKEFKYFKKYLKEDDNVSFSVKKEGKLYLFKALIPSINKDMLTITQKEEEFYSGVSFFAKRVKEIYLNDRDKFVNAKKRKESCSKYQELVNPEEDFEDIEVSLEAEINPVLDLKYS